MSSNSRDALKLVENLNSLNTIANLLKKDMKARIDILDSGLEDHQRFNKCCQFTDRNKSEFSSIFKSSK
uniref:Uncharacterized protein n=1 Tax=viral metagenome TaxID=1070528 RepID=A0A6C0LSM0_9ZZZZ